MIHRRSYLSTSSYKKVSGLYKRIAMVVKAGGLYEEIREARRVAV
jgi:hypothetical protein